MTIASEASSYQGWSKFKDIDAQYFSYLADLLSAPPEPVDLLHQFPAYVGHVNLGRYLFLYEMYKKVLNLAGHVAELGVYKGATFLFFAKLVRLFETHSSTQVYGFDWFKGMLEHPEASPGEVPYVGDYAQLVKLIESQQLQDVALLQRLDLSTESELYLQKHPHLRFKLIFVDCGQPNVLRAGLSNFWPRLVTGGVLVLDHYNLECSPQESELVDQTIGTNCIRKLPFNRQPTAYVVKRPHSRKTSR